MNDVQVYGLRSKLREAEALLKVANAKVSFDWGDNPCYPLQLAQVCALIADLILDVGTAAWKEINVTECTRKGVVGAAGAEHKNRVREPSGPDVAKEGTEPGKRDDDPAPGPGPVEDPPNM